MVTRPDGQPAGALDLAELPELGVKVDSRDRRSAQPGSMPWRRPIHAIIEPDPLTRC
jgi:hypothetical protein